MTAAAILAFVFCFSVLAYQQAALSVWALGLGLFLLLSSVLLSLSTGTLLTVWLIFLFFFFPLLCAPFRQRCLTKPILALYRNLMPSMSRTEREALNAGTVGWEGDLFSGRPDWHKLQALPLPQLTQEEKDFLEGPVETLCSMIDDWDITHQRADLPPAVWDFLKKEGFFSLLIPKQYGGKGFSNYASSQ